MTAAPIQDTIVVGFDGRSHGLDALYLAATLADDATAVVACCVHPGRDGARARAEAEQRLRVAREVLAERRPSRFSVREATSPAAGLHAEAGALGAELLVVGSSHRAPVGKVLPGGVTRQAMLGAPCPIAVAPAWLQSDDDPVIRVVGVAYDGSEGAREALSVAASIAERIGAELCVLTVVEPPDADWASAWIWPPTADPDACTAIEHDVLTRLPGTGTEGATVHVLEGDPVEELVDASRSIDLLVLGSRGYGPPDRVVPGHVGGRVAESAVCPVIVVPRARDAGDGRCAAPVASHAVPRSRIGAV